MEHWRQTENQQYPQNDMAPPARNATYDDYPHDPYTTAAQPQYPHGIDTHPPPGSQPDSPYEDPYTGAGTAYPQYSSDPRPLPPHQESFEGAFRDDVTPGGFQANEPQDLNAESQANLFNAPTDKGAVTSEKVAGPTFRPARSGGNVRSWRHDEHSKLWTKGGGVRTCGRFCCCTIFSLLFLIFSIFLTLLLWVRPPDVTFNGIATDSKNPAVFSAESLTVDIGASISVANPNYFSVAFDQIKAQGFHPLLPNTPLGSGQVTGINFESGHETTFTFPFEIKYIFSQDQDYAVLKDIAAKCGLMGSPRSKLPLDYKFTVKIKGIAIPVTVRGSTRIDCPLTDDQLKTLSGFSGIFGNGGATPTPPA